MANIMDREFKVAYLAGVMDSDGYFTIHRNLKQSVNPTYSPDMGINQTSSQAIDLAYELFAGKVSKIDYSKTENRYSKKPMLTWRPHKSGLVLVLKELIPYLRIKRAQAEILLRLRADIVFHGRTGGKEKRTLSSQTVEFRTKLYGQFKRAQSQVAETECEDFISRMEKRQSDLIGDSKNLTEMLRSLDRVANDV